MTALTLTVVLAVGALAFGAVYEWAYAPLAACVVVGSGAVLWRSPREALAWRPLPVATGLVIAVIALQLIPLPQWLLTALTPGAHLFLSAYKPSYALAPAPTHPVSVDPPQTAFALVALLILALWTTAVSRLLTRRSVLPDLARNLTGLGTAVALIGMAQQATFNGKLLWFWEPTFSATNSFGPFVNRNHFAGWMLLTLAVSGGYLVALLHQPAGRRHGVRNRLLWLGSREASSVVLAAAAAMTMAVSLIWTLSRSGIVGGAVAMTVLMLSALHKASGTARRLVAAGGLALAFVAAVAWKGAGNVLAWYHNTGTLEWRFTLWADSLAALQDFWLTGAGLNTYGTLMLVYPRTDLSVHPREAHNDYLQLAIEGGLLVGIPVLLLILAIAREIGRRVRQPQDVVTWWIRMGSVAAMCGIAVQELSEFSLQIPGVALLFATCLAIAIHEPAPVSVGGLRRRALRRDLIPQHAIQNLPDGALR